MRRASTPLHEFEIPIDPTTISKIKLTYSQDDKIVLEKSKDDLTNTGDEWWRIELTQEETNLFKSDLAEVQIRVLTNEGKSIPSQIMKIYVGPVLNDEVMTL